MIFQILLLLCSLANLIRSNNATITNSFNCFMAKNATVSYKNNVNIIYSEFTNQTSVMGYYNTSVGLSPNKVYGYYMCRGDTTPEVCHGCIVNATLFAQNANCAHQDGIYYSEMCVFRYASHSMFGIWQEGPVIEVSPIGNEESKSLNYNTTFNHTMEALIHDAAFGCNNNKKNKSNGCIQGVATREANVTRNETIYTLGQCTPDIAGVNCSKCLTSALIWGSGYERYQGMQIYQPNCVLIYGNTLFYHVYDVQKVIPTTGRPYIQNNRSKVSTSTSLKIYVDLYFVIFTLVSCTFLVLV